MPELTPTIHVEPTTPVAETPAPAAPKVPKVPKPKAKAAAKAKPAPAKKTDGTIERRSELRNPQIKLLVALRNGKPLTRSKLMEKCPGVGLTEHLGPLKAGIVNPYTVSLLEHKFVKGEKTEDQGVVYTITASGLKALERIEKTQKETK